MKISIKQDVEVAKLKVRAGVRYWEDSTVNGVEDVEGDLIPCREGDNWCPVINIDTGIIENWEQGKAANIHYKVCDDGNYSLLDKDNNLVIEKEGYVVDCLSIDDNGYGDYIILKVDENGKIKNWMADFSDFEESED